MSFEAGPARERELLSKLSRWRQIALITTALLVLCTAALIVLALRRPPAAAPAPTPPPLIEPSEQPSGASAIEAGGTLAPSNVQPVFSTGGRVREWHCKSGEQVRKGQKIVTVTSETVEVELARAQAWLTERTALIDALAKSMDKAKSLGDDNARARFEVELVRAGVQRQQAAEQLEALNRRKSEGTVLSPLDGTVIVSAPDELIGRLVSPSEPICRVADPRGAWHADVWFAEHGVGILLRSLDQAKDGGIAVEVVADAFPDRVFRGTLNRDDVARELTRRDDGAVLAARVRLDEDSERALRMLPMGSKVRVKVSVPEQSAR